MAEESIVPIRRFHGRSIAKVSEALAKAQADFPKIEKSKEVLITSSKGDYGFKYADLADIMSATRPALSANGLSISQGTEIIPMNGREILRTFILHSSGEFLESETLVPAATDMKQAGGALTYLRRYQASALLGVAAEDDNDAKELDGVTTGPQRRDRPPQAPRSAPTGPASIPKPTTPDDLKKEAVAVGEQIVLKLKEKNWTMAQADFLVRARFKVEPPNMSLGQMKAFLRIIDKEPPPDTAEPAEIPPPKVDGGR